MIHFEFALIKGFCLGFTIDEIDEVLEMRFFLGLLYIGIIFENE
tara:strand:- start:600 stop:731 length:132 start_codon:yes stop_codon:yes gene_type:complete